MWTLEDQEFDYIDVDRQNEDGQTSDELGMTGGMAGNHYPSGSPDVLRVPGVSRTKAHYASCLSGGKAPSNIGGLAINSPDVSKISIL